MQRIRGLCLRVSLLLLVTIAYPWSEMVWAEESPSDLVKADFKKWVVEAEVLREQGDLILAQRKLDQALQSVKDSNADSKDYAAVELAAGYNLFLLNRLNAAEQLLKSAYPKTLGDNYLKALVDQYLANLYLANGDTKQAQFHIDSGLNVLRPGEHEDLRLSLELLNWTAMDENAQKLLALATRIEHLADGMIKAKLSLKVVQLILDFPSTEALPAQLVSDLHKQGYQMLARLRDWSEQNQQPRVKAEALGKLALLYTWQNRPQEALLLTEQALSQIQDGNEKELLAQLSAQKGNLLRSIGDNEHALSAYEVAITNLYAVRADMPISLPDGRNLLKTVIDPIYRNYVDLLLQTAAVDNTEFAKQQLIKAIDSMEAIKEADMQDFFLGRCSVGRINKQTWQNQSLHNAAVLYPILLKDRIELVLKTDEKLIRRTVKVAQEDVQNQALVLVEALQHGKDYRSSSKQLYEWLILPVKEELRLANPGVVLYVPDRSLRAVPLSVLSDGHAFVIEQYGVVTLPSLDMHNLTAQKDKRQSHDVRTLLAGLSKPDGSSIDQLPRSIADNLSNDKLLAREQMIEELSLPSVEKEIGLVADRGASTTLLNQQFTADALKSDMETGQYGQVHIASHGYFGKNAKESFIMAYDKNMSLLDIKDTLEAETLKAKPIELLTLSACKTSVGDDRMLLGFSGLAVKSNVLSAVGSLWSINDDATMEFMRLFYDGMSKSLDKAQSMREAQIAMIKNKKFKHPFFWSPFILIGNWQ